MLIASQLIKFYKNFNKKKCKELTKIFECFTKIKTSTKWVGKCIFTSPTCIQADIKPKKKIR